jgi:hypothetical protein
MNIPTYDEAVKDLPKRPFHPELSGKGTYRKFRDLEAIPITILDGSYSNEMTSEVTFAGQTTNIHPGVLFMACLQGHEDIAEDRFLVISQHGAIIGKIRKLQKNNKFPVRVTIIKMKSTSHTNVTTGEPLEYYDFI